MKNLICLTSLFLLFTQFSSAQFFQKTDQRGISNYYTTAMLLPDSTLILSEGIQESGALRSALKAENIDGEILWEILSEDTTEVLLYQNLILIDENTFGVLGYHQTCCDCSNPVTIYETRSIETGELIEQEVQVLPNVIVNNAFLNNQRSATRTSWGFSIINSGFTTSTVFNLSSQGDLLDFYTVPGVIKNTASLNGDLIVPSNQTLYRHDVEGEALDSVEVSGAPLAIANSTNTVALLFGATIVLFDSNLDEIGTTAILEGDYLISGTESGFTLVSEEMFYRIADDGTIEMEFEFQPISGFEAETITALDDIYVLAGAKRSESFSIDQISHRHAAYQIHDNGGSANLWHTDLTLTDIVIDEIELVQGDFYVDYNATVSVTVENTGSFPVEGFYLNHAQSSGICFPSIQHFYRAETIPNFESLTLTLSGVSGYTLPSSGDSLFLRVCVFATNPMDQMDWDLSDDSICSEEYYTLSIEDVDLSNFIEVHPNPSVGRFTVESMLRMERIQIFNAHGRLIKEINTSGMHTLNVEDLPTGLYLIKIYTEKGPVTKKMVIGN